LNKILLTLAVGCISAFQAQAWDPTGHMLIGEIAWNHLDPAVREKVAPLVAQAANHQNMGRPYNFTTVGCWMDDLRADKDYAWSKWHYVDGPWTSSGTPFVEPEAPHLLWAIDQCIAQLKKPDASEKERTIAVSQLIHLIGDLHQPLHTTTWDDKGGNGYLVFGIPFSDLMAKQGGNLHTFWDKAFRFDGVNGQNVEQYPGLSKIEERPSAPREEPLKSIADAIEKNYPPDSLFQLETLGTHRDWARESHVIGCLAGYPDVPHPRDTGGVKLDPEFVHRANGIANQRIALAGYRLARLLDELFK